MAADDPISLRDLHDAICADLAAQYAGRIETVAAYEPFPLNDDQDRIALTTPALLLELEAIDPGEDDGTDRQPLRLSWVIHCILSFQTDLIQVELRSMAGDVLAHVRHNRWGFVSAVREPEALSAQAGEFVPDLAGYDSWVVRWEQIVYLGTDIWAGGIAPVEIYLGIAPRIGAAHVDDYWRVNELPDV